MWLRHDVSTPGWPCVKPEQVDLVARTTPQRRWASPAGETVAIRRTFGAHADKLAVTANKSMTGHMFAASGALEAADVRVVDRAERDPADDQLREHADPDCDLDYVPNVAREQQIDIVLSNSFGFGGQNACLVLQRLCGD